MDREVNAQLFRRAAPAVSGLRLAVDLHFAVSCQPGDRVASRISGRS
jgi:hypothetical protein